MRSTRILLLRALPGMALGITALLLTAPLAVAASPTPQDTPEAAIVADAAQAETPTAAAGDEDMTVTRRHCLRSTGSLITASRNQRARREGKPLECGPAFGRAYTREDLQTTGGTDLGDMLRRLDPSIR